MTTRDIVLSALFTAIIIVLGFIPPVPIPLLPVPITAQSMGVMLAGCIIGAKRGAAAYALLVLLVAVGLPVLSGGRGGLNVLMGPTGGYIFGWIIGTFTAADGEALDGPAALSSSDASPFPRRASPNGKSNRSSPRTVDARRNGGSSRSARSASTGPFCSFSRTSAQSSKFAWTRQTGHPSSRARAWASIVGS